MLWIIRLARKKHENEIPFPATYADIFTPPLPGKIVPDIPGVPLAAVQSAAVSAAPAASAAVNAAPAEAPRVSIEAVSEQLARIEAHLQQIATKLEQPVSAQVNINDELKTLLQSKSAPSKNDSAQISELSSKIEKIYQVLASISGSAR